MRKFVGLLVIAALVLVTGQFAFAQSADVATKSFTLQPGGKAVVKFEGFCADFGQKFPQSGIKPPVSTVDQATQDTIYYALTKGYNKSDPLAMQYAIWTELKSSSLPASPKPDITSEIVSSTTKAPALSGTSVLDAVKDGKVKLTMDSWAATGDKVQIGAAQDHFYGSGQLTLENTSKEALTLSMPVGTLFVAPDSSSQDIAGYATDVQVTNPTLPDTGIAENISLSLIGAVALGLIALAFVMKRASRVNT